MAVTSRIFLLDSNVLMTAHRSYYAMDICPGFWRAMIDGYTAGRVFSTKSVLAEINRGKDALKDWCKELPKGFFLDDQTEEVAQEFAPMMQWVQNEQYTLAAINEFANVADGWLIACAKVHGYVTVTNEAYNAGSKRRVPMPNVIEQFKGQYTNCYTMLRELDVSFE